MDKVTLKAADGVPLAARIFVPAGTPRGNVVIGGAMGVRQDYYGSFAAWLAGQGWRVTTFDYRGNLTLMTDAAGNATKVEYNALNLPVKLTDAKAGVIWLQIPAKSMLLNERAGSRFVDRCMHAEQRAAVEAVQGAAANTVKQ